MTRTEIADNAEPVMSTRGTLVKTSFEVESGRRVQFEMSRKAGGNVPSGAQARDEKASGWAW